MAGELPLHHILLYDKWPGKSNPNLGIPAGGWDSTLYSCCQTAPTYPPGMKISAYQDHTYCEGAYTMCYMCFLESSDLAQDLGAISDTYGICGDIGGEGADSVDLLEGSYGGVVDYTESLWWIVTNCHSNSDVSACGRIAVCAHDMSTGEFGWFWVGGVCPVGEVTKFDGQAAGVGSEMGGDGNIVMGSKLMPDANANDGIEVIPWDGTFEYTPCGLALEADA